MNNKIYLIACSLIVMNCMNIAQSSLYDSNSIFGQQQDNISKEQYLNDIIDEFISRIQPDNFDQVRNYINMILQYAYSEDYNEYNIDVVESFEEVLNDFKKNESARELYKIISNKNNELLQDHDFLLLFREMLKLNNDIENGKVENQTK